MLAGLCGMTYVISFFLAVVKTIGLIYCDRNRSDSLVRRSSRDRRANSLLMECRRRLVSHWIASVLCIHVDIITFSIKMWHPPIWEIKVCSV